MVCVFGVDVRISKHQVHPIVLEKGLLLLFGSAVAFPGASVDLHLNILEGVGVVITLDGVVPRAVVLDWTGEVCKVLVSH